MTIRPVRLQLSRRRGFDLQKLSRETNGLDAVNCARPGVFGNPFTVADCGTVEQAVRRFKAAVAGFESNGCFCPPQAHPDSTIGRIIASLEDLRGKNLACWCAPGAPCHADVLLEIANRPTCRGETP